MMDNSSTARYKQTIRKLSDRIVVAQKPIQILDALKWNVATEEEFFKHQCRQLPAINEEYYKKHNPLSFDPVKKSEEFNDIEQSIRRELGEYSGVGSIMQRMCHEYKRVIEMLQARGTDKFTEISKELYGSAKDVFHAGAPTLNDLASVVNESLANIKDQVISEKDEKKYTSSEAVKILSNKLDPYFSDDKIHVEISDGIIADASAGADKIKLNKELHFSERQLRMLEVHEGWVHLGTTLNGLEQPVCTFLSKGPPSSTVTQEGLGIITELITFSSYPDRLKRLTDRITAVGMAEDGANFIDVYQFFRHQGLDEKRGYHSTQRIFRGSLPEKGPYTKDLAYSKGFILIYNYMRLAVQKGLVSRIPLLFIGKTSLEDLHILDDLVGEGLVTPPKYVPPQFADLAAISAWMVYSLFMNKIDLDRLALDFKTILQ